ncbi:phytoene desaturase family protein [Thalassotalea agarivorans]|uniref:All-trans-retinol 13,14-reductase n=1 Tax=Thalassotalea agarivorans TaxID=349064 RepID=A0A1I0CK85_THASX|nr:NAD(P)/FAD-dependent oxidoreductase [Thalassotalea agarivorans]SET19983.1 all-trans-retinol 13,14-reductase [Thalassotalea agarivorans]
MTEATSSPKKVSVRTGRRFQPKNVKDDYDLIVIGSGIGGLTCAAVMSLMGKKVCVLEQHYTAGGFTHAYQRKGYEWDVGVHYIGEVHRPQTPLRKIFDTISGERLKWQAMDDVYDRIIIGDKHFDLPAGTDNFINALVKEFPQEEKAIQQYVSLVREISYHSNKFFAGQALPKWLATIYNKFRPVLLKKVYFQTTREVLESLTQNQELIAVLTGQWGDYGLPPAESSFLMHALLVKHYLNGSAYPVGGAAAIAREIIPTITAQGGDVFTDAEVTSLLCKSGKVTGVKLANGHQIKANIVVSNTGYLNSYSKLLPNHLKTADFEKKLPKIKRSGASLCLYAGFTGTADMLGLETTNLWIYQSPDHELQVTQYKTQAHADGNFPLIYISFPSAKDPTWDSRFPNKTTVEIVTLSHMKWFEQWKDTEWNKRGEEYEALKESMSQKLLKVLFEHRPQLEAALDYYELSTPLSTLYYQHNDEGEIYGLDHSIERFTKYQPHPETPLKGFYLTGADTLTAGVGGATMAGIITAMRIVGLRKAGEIKKIFK